ncbi:hypothetical protein AB0N81_30095 [Streptomyces sp. NPDC093510]|uniref:hypothetical protein n=1 Tax=Streptomyces sp. NPDC093510 TaxID=3155199 RepID=UPI00341D3506
MTELQQGRLAELIRPIRESLDLYDLGADPDIATRETPQLVAAADSLCELVRATHLNKAAQQLPVLIAELTTAAYRNPSSELSPLSNPRTGQLTTSGEHTIGLRLVDEQAIPAGGETAPSPANAVRLSAPQ